MTNGKNSKVTFSAMVGTKHFKKFEKSADSFMNSTWEKFNNYAHGKGFTIQVEDQIFFGGMAWSNNESEIMKLVKM